MSPAEGTDHIDDPIHIPERHPVHPPVQFFKSFSELHTIHPVVFTVPVIKHIQDGSAISITVVWRIVRHIAF